MVHLFHFPCYGSIVDTESRTGSADEQSGGGYISDRFMYEPFAMTLSQIIEGTADQRGSQTQKFCFKLSVAFLSGGTTDIRRQRFYRAAIFVRKEHRRKAVVRFAVDQDRQDMGMIMQ